MRERLALFIGACRIRFEGWERAEKPSPFWDRVVNAVELERALDHIHAGGMGCSRFPYLPVFEVADDV